MLVGLVLDGKWTVIKALEKKIGSSGGNFSVQYIARDQSGKEAFVKAIDISENLHSAGDDAPDWLNALTELFIFERDLLSECRAFSRIVKAIGSGTISAGTIPDCYEAPVYYLIFELAEGDARSQSNLGARLDVPLALRSLHHVATGMRQLHSRLIAHQDLKPSNVLMFKESGGDRTSKIGDVGRATKFGSAPPKLLAGMPVLGDLGYASPELLYEEIADDWRRCRLGADLYLLGSLIVSFFTGVSMTALLHRYLASDHSWGDWTDGYRTALPHVRAAFETALVRDVEPSIRSYIATAEPSRIKRKWDPAGEIITAVRNLCDPDPELRGHSVDRGSNPYSLERYIAMFDRLATAAETKLL